MPRRTTSTAAVQPSKGSRITFDENSYIPQASSSNSIPINSGVTRYGAIDDDEDEDEGDEPEALGTTVLRDIEMQEAENEEM